MIVLRPEQMKNAMKTKETYLQLFDDYETAFDFMARKNWLRKKTNNRNVLCLIQGPDEIGYAVVDERTAIELSGTYVWATSTTSWIENPWKKKSA